MKFEITTSEVITRSYVVTAENAEEAKELFNSGEFDALILETLEDMDILCVTEEGIE